MRKVILFIAMSLDGYIADENGGVNWLNGEDENAEDVDTYSLFVKDIDTVIMGWNTYHQENLIDTYYISVIPTILGKGIRLFGTLENEIRLELEKTQTYNGITELVYERKILFEY